MSLLVSSWAGPFCGCFPGAMLVVCVNLNPIISLVTLSTLSTPLQITPHQPVYTSPPGLMTWFQTSFSSSPAQRGAIPPVNHLSGWWETGWGGSAALNILLWDLQIKSQTWDWAVIIREAWEVSQRSGQVSSQKYWKEIFWFISILSSSWWSRSDLYKLILNSSAQYLSFSQRNLSDQSKSDISASLPLPLW